VSGGALVSACCCATEACCFYDGTCTDVTRGQCILDGGTPMGAGTDCAGTSCDQACCFVNGDCEILSCETCELWEGECQGFLSDCGPPNPCPQPTVEACCNPDTGECQEIDLADCLLLGHLPQGPGSSCTPNPCECPQDCTDCQSAYTVTVSGIAVDPSYSGWPGGRTCGQSGTTCYWCAGFTVLLTQVNPPTGCSWTMLDPFICGVNQCGDLTVWAGGSTHLACNAITDTWTFTTWFDISMYVTSLDICHHTSGGMTFELSGAGRPCPEGAYTLVDQSTILLPGAQCSIS
jgi:hypothetical protein